MRRTARALSAAFAAGAVLALTGPAAFAGPTVSAGTAAFAGPAAEASPGTGSVSVVCDPVLGPVPVPTDAGAPAGPESTSCGQDGAVRDGGGQAGAGVEGEGPAGGVREDAGGDGAGKAGAGEVGAGRDGAGRDSSGQAGAGQDGGGRESAGRDQAAPDGTGQDGAGRDGGRQDGAGRECTQAGAGDCGHDDHACGDSRGTRCPDGDGHSCRDSHDDPGCTPAAVQHGVDAGQGGTFNDSVPALAAGAACIAAACAGAGYRLYGHRRSPGGPPTGM
ncbi:hypothetical protein [Streptomyces sp. NPDC005890]|uniref:hypothetical protein n=1 Tax=Streptomyces sp. NPDC005890 TaxID=3154568 RepID=UPI0033C11A2F